MLLGVFLLHYKTGVLLNEIEVEQVRWRKIDKERKRKRQAAQTGLIVDKHKMEFNINNFGAM